MYLDQADTAPPTGGQLLDAARAAGRAIPPAFPLAATVAVNPFMGQAGEDLATAAARLGRVAGARIVMPRAHFASAIAAGRITEADLAAALAESGAAEKPASVAALRDLARTDRSAPVAIPTVADIARDLTGIDWPAVIARCFGLWAAGHFDRGQALWTPTPGQSAFTAWRMWASRDLTPEIAGLSGFCAHVAHCPDTPARAIRRAADRLGIGPAEASGVFHRLLATLGGWAQHGRWIGWQAELAGRTDDTLVELVAVRLVWEEALLAHVPAAAEAWAAALAAHAAPVAPSADDVADAILQEAAERAHQRRLAGLLGGTMQARSRPAMQAVFCIDVRSEVYRRALEQADPEAETHGFAGFFGLPVAHRASATDEADAHLPVLLTPTVRADSRAESAIEAKTRIGRRAVRAWGRFRQAAVSSFAFVEAAGVAYGAKLLADALGLDRPETPAPAPRFEAGLTAEAKGRIAAGILTAMGLVEGHARLVLLLGHGSRLRNNPQASAYQCGACGGQTGEVSARLAAALLNDPETRVALKERHGIVLPADTLFVGGLHDTATDRVTLHPEPGSESHAADLERAGQRLEVASAIARIERAARLPGAGSEKAVLARARNWAETRPEWGLAGCAAFVAAPRAATAGRNLEGRAFLHGYDWRRDEGFRTLELIMTAPVVVASWISLQYYGSTVANETFGSGDKLIHNVVGGFGVRLGNGGNLVTGLPLQAVGDGERIVHEPLRLTICIEAPLTALNEILARHGHVRNLFDHGWLHLVALSEGRFAARYTPQGWRHIG